MVYIYVFLAIFHYLEFIFHAIFHPKTLSSEYFLLNHSTAYHIAIIASIIEYWWTKSTNRSYITVICGIIMILIGQYTRSIAMWHAKNFTHKLRFEKDDDHILVTSGIYKYLRHPSYFGFYWFSLGTQLFIR